MKYRVFCILLALCLLCGCTRVAEVPQAEPAPVPSFSDVAEGSWYRDAVITCCEKGLMQGVSEESFAPNDPVTRAMLVTVLWRGAGSPEAGPAGFSDVAEGKWYSNAVGWASGKNIVNGVGDNIFAPGSPVTREQTAAILLRWSRLGESGVHGLSYDADSALLDDYADRGSISPWAEDAMLWAVANGLLGRDEPDSTKLRPGDATTRAELCVILARLTEK